MLATEISLQSVLELYATTMSSTECSLSRCIKRMMQLKRKDQTVYCTKEIKYFMVFPPISSQPQKSMEASYSNEAIYGVSYQIVVVTLLE